MTEITAKVAAKLLKQALKIAEKTTEADTDPLPRACVRFRVVSGCLVVSASDYFHYLDQYSQCAAEHNDFSIASHCAAALVKLLSGAKGTLRASVTGSLATFRLDGTQILACPLAPNQWWQSQASELLKNFPVHAGKAVHSSAAGLAKHLKATRGVGGYTALLSGDRIEGQPLEYTGEPVSQTFARHQLIRLLEYSKGPATLDIYRSEWQPTLSGGQRASYALTITTPDGLAMLTAYRT